MPDEKATADQSTPRLAERLAERISHDVLASGWQIGDVLGTESALLTRYNTSRNSFREAVRILEREGLAHMRSGPRGGLTVVNTAEHVVAQTLANYLAFTNVSLTEILECRAILEGLGVQLATNRVMPTQLETLRASVAKIEAAQAADRTDVQEHMNIRHVIAESTQNPALALCLDTVSELTTNILYFRYGGLTIDDPEIRRARPEIRQLETDCKKALVEAIANGDQEEARRLVQLDHEIHRKLAQTQREHLDHLRKHRAILSRKQRLQGLIRNDDGKAKLPELLSRTIAADIHDAGWPVGRWLGSESDLINAFGVSRAALREAIRLLERDNIVERRRGGGGGLFIATPSPRYVVASALKYLSYMSLSPAHYVEVRSELETQAAQLAAKRITADQARQLNAANDLIFSKPLDRFAALGAEFHALIGELSGNRAIALLNEIVVAMTARSIEWSYEMQARARDTTKQTHPKIVDAITRGDAGESRRAVLAHVDQTLLDVRLDEREAGRKAPALKKLLE